MEDHSREVIAQLDAQLDMLIKAAPGLLALGPNAEQLVNMGRAMVQGAQQIPSVSPVQNAYKAGLQTLADTLARALKPAV